MKVGNDYGWIVSPCYEGRMPGDRLNRESSIIQTPHLSLSERGSGIPDFMFSLKMLSMS